MKFFGYISSKKPTHSDVAKEINLMQSLVGITNVVQIEGIFLDSQEGYVPNRIYDDPYPVIVMEALLGGDLFERLQSPGDHMTERFLATAFRGVIEALHQTHSRGFIHRDLKLENLIYTSLDPNSSIKVSTHSPLSLSVCLSLSVSQTLSIRLLISE
jgi:serine/threonine protein kinase